MLRKQVLERLAFPDPVISQVVEPKSSADRDRLTFSATDLDGWRRRARRTWLDAIGALV